ncbi:S8 family serine peptidase [Candidatus Riflebacteria bacterium]
MEDHKMHYKFIRKVFCFLFFAIIFGNAGALLAAQDEKIDPKLKEKMQQKSKKTYHHSIIIEVAGLQGLQSADLGADRKTILNTLKSLTKESQTPVLDELKKLASKGMVKNIEPLYLGNYIIVRALAKAIETLSDNDAVTYIHDDKIWSLPIEPTNNKVNKGEVNATYGLKKINAIRTWKEYGIRGNGVLAGNLDTGVDSQHPDLKGKIKLFKNFTSDTGDAAGFDGHGHGTHTIGTMVGGDKSGKAIGVAPGAKIVSGKIFTGSGSTQSSWILKAMEWVADPDGNPSTNDAPALVSNSWGGRKGSIESEKPMWDLVQRWVDLNIVPIFAAGNSGPSASTVGTPGGYPHSWAVGATDSTDKIARFSSRGPISWQGKEYIKPEISAPGVDVYSAKPGGGYQNMSGTSMATPHAAGAMCLLLQAAPGINVKQAQEMFESTSDDLGTAGWDNDFGHGRMDIYKAVTKAMFGGKVAGTVQGAGGQTLANATVGVKNGDISFVTEANGSFAGFLKEGNYNLEARAFGYLAQVKKAKVVKKQTTIVNFTLAKAAAGKLTGSVKSQNGTPIKATLKLTNTPVAVVESGANGVFSIDAPKGSYKLRVSALGYKAQYQDVNIPGSLHIVLEALPPILLVDDDKGKDYEKYFKAAIESLGKEYTYFKVNGNGPDATTLGQYPMVVWFTGSDYSTTLTAADQSNLLKYLNAGGQLLITGQDLGYNIKNTSFFKTSLGANFVNDTAANKTVTGPVNGSLTGGTGANNQKYPDVITANGSGKLTFKYGDGAGAGTTVGDKVIYLAFGLEGMATEGGRKAMMEYATDKFLSGKARLNYFLSLVKRVEELKQYPGQEYTEMLLAEEGLRKALQNQMKTDKAFAREVKELAKKERAFRVLY